VLPHEVELVEEYYVVDNNTVDKAIEEDMPEEEPAATVAVCIQFLQKNLYSSQCARSSTIIIRKEK
jgi:hypothetical protein